MPNQNDITRRVMQWAAKEGLLDADEIPAIEARLDADAAKATPAAPAPAAPAPAAPAAAPAGSDFSGMTVEEMRAKSREMAAADPTLAARRADRIRAEAMAVLRQEADQIWEVPDDQLVDVEYVVEGIDGQPEISTVPMTVNQITAFRALVDNGLTPAEAEEIRGFVDEDTLSAVVQNISRVDQEQAQAEFDAGIEARVSELATWPDMLQQRAADAVASNERFRGLDPEALSNAARVEIANAMLEGALSFDDMSAEDAAGLLDDVLQREAFRQHQEAEAQARTEAQQGIADEAGITRGSEDRFGEVVLRDILDADGLVVDRVPLRTPFEPDLSQKAYDAWLAKPTFAEQQEWADKITQKYEHLDTGISPEEVEQLTAEMEAREEAEFRRFQAERRRPGSELPTRDLEDDKVEVVPADAMGILSADPTDAELEAFAEKMNADIDERGI